MADNFDDPATAGKEGEDFDDFNDSDKSESEFSDSDSDEGESDTGLTENQNRIMYLISLYSHPAQSEVEKEEWIRRQALEVLAYEGIVAQVLDYDYAPMSKLVQSRRKYFNISQEATSDIDFLREEELINGLKLSSKDYTPVTCYQISSKGLDLLKQVSKADKEAVHELAYAPGTRELLKVHWTGQEYWLHTDAFKRRSTVTETEDVSYVSSAYIPQCLRHGGRPTLSNAHRAHECNTGESNLKDELDEVITLNSVSCIVAEFIPTGANQIVALNNNIGSTERVQGGFFSALVDENSSGTKFEVPPGLTSINILDYTLTGHVNFEADIHFPEEEGIVQVETFGVSMHSDGTMYYGMQVEAVMDRIKDNISLDHLSRLLVDVQQDSSKIVDSVISAYQRGLMDVIFQGDAENRDKFTLIVANEITPHLTAEEYMDKGEYENELKQVVGETRAAFDVSEHDTLIFGSHGFLLAGPNSRHHEPLLCSFLQFQSLDVFVRNYFSRMFLIGDAMKTVRDLIDTSHTDPKAVHAIRGRMAVIASQVILMEEILGYMRLALVGLKVPAEPPEQSGRSLYERLSLDSLKGQLELRIRDLEKNASGTRHEMEFLQGMGLVVSDNKLHAMTESMSKNTRRLCDLNGTNERTAISMEVMQTLIAGLLAFCIVDRITGEWSVVNTEWAAFLVEPMIKNTPFVWFFFNMIIAIIVGVIVIWLQRRKQYVASGKIIFRRRVERLVNLKKLKSYIASKSRGLIYEECHFEMGNDIVIASFRDPDRRDWGGANPVISIEYDARHKYMLFLTVEYPKRWAKSKLAFNMEEIVDKIDLQMK